MLLAALAAAAAAREQATDDRDALIRKGAALRIPKNQLAQAARLTRRAVYDVLSR